MSFGGIFTSICFSILGGPLLPTVKLPDDFQGGNFDSIFLAIFIRICLLPTSWLPQWLVGGKHVRLQITMTCVRFPGRQPVINIGFFYKNIHNISISNSISLEFSGVLHPCFSEHVKLSRSYCVWFSLWLQVIMREMNRECTYACAHTFALNMQCAFMENLGRSWPTCRQTRLEYIIQ